MRNVRPTEKAMVFSTRVLHGPFQVAIVAVVKKDVLVGVFGAGVQPAGALADLPRGAPREAALAAVLHPALARVRRSSTALPNWA